MNKLTSLSIAFILLHIACVAQKPLVGLYGEVWESPAEHQISNDGQYVAYTVQQALSGSDLYVWSGLSGDQLHVPGAMLVDFTQDSRQVIYSKGDTVGIAGLRAPGGVTELAGVSTFWLTKRGRKQDLLLYRVREKPDALVVREVETGKERTYPAADNYWVSEDGNVLVLEMVKRDSVGVHSTLNWLDMESGKMKAIWSGNKIKEVKVGYNDDGCVFLSKAAADSSGNDSNDLWVYGQKQEVAEKVVDGRGEQGGGDQVTGINSFNVLDGRIFVTMKESVVKSAGKPSAVGVDIWSYKDAVLQSEQLGTLEKHPNRAVTYKAVVNISDRRLIRLEYSNEVVLSSLYTDKAMHYVLASRSGEGSTSEWNWNSRSRQGIWLIDLENGKQRLIADNVSNRGLNAFILTYGEHYVCYYNGTEKAYYSYRIRDSVRRNITAGVPAHWDLGQGRSISHGSWYAYGVAGLLKHTDAVLVYDRNDLYELDPAREAAVRDLTKGVRQSGEWMFRMVGNQSAQVIDSNERICLTVFDRKTKSSGLTVVCVRPLSSGGGIQMAPYSYDVGMPQRARDTTVYVVGRMSAEESPNLFVTNDFRHYMAVTDIHPEHGYNWMRTELVTWKTTAGVICQGILYKPENFDPQKKYPLLVHYYERLSDDLHKFIPPDMSSGDLNIPYYVSHGYLVFEPDIVYTLGWPGRSAYTCVMSGVQHLLGRSYVDRERLGLQGHSYGGFETNYIVAHTTLFKAAMSAAGVSDLISLYGSIPKNSPSKQYVYENSQGRIGASLWERPTAYVENSAVFRADKISTPMLLMANKADMSVYWQQGVELFTALRRLGKKAWMLQYDGEEHNLYGTEAQKDFTLRMSQFFNYYLKGETPPRWMTTGVPVAEKGYDTGLETDKTGVMP